MDGDSRVERQFSAVVFLLLTGSQATQAGVVCQFGNGGNATCSLGCCDNKCCSFWDHSTIDLTIICGIFLVILTINLCYRMPSCTCFTCSGRETEKSPFPTTSLTVHNVNGTLVYRPTNPDHAGYDQPFTPISLTPTSQQLFNTQDRERPRPVSRQQPRQPGVHIHRKERVPRRNSAQRTLPVPNSVTISRNLQQTCRCMTLPPDPTNTGRRDIHRAQCSRTRQCSVDVDVISERQSEHNRTPLTGVRLVCPTPETNLLADSRYVDYRSINGTV